MFMTSVKNTTNKGLTNKLTSNKLNSLYIFETLVGEVVVGFTPLDLFQSGEQGVWYDPSDLTTLFQDDAGTTPVTSDGDPVGLMLDKSGNGNHATQSVSASRPTYRNDGTLHWLEGDGIDDMLVSANFGLSQPLSITVGAVANNSSDFILDGLVTNSSSLITTAGTIRLRAGVNLLNNVPFTLGQKTVIKAVIDGENSEIGFNNDTSTTGNAGPSDMEGVTLMSGGGGTNYLDGNIYGVVVVDRVITSGESSNTTSYMAEKAGVTL
jgi:hypothetical protein